MPKFLKIGKNFSIFEFFKMHLHMWGGGGFLKMMKMMKEGGYEIYLLLFSAIVVVPDREILSSQGRVFPQGGNPGPFFGLKLDLPFNGANPNVWK